MEYYLVVKNNSIRKLEGKWIKLEKILNEVTQTQKDKYGIYSQVDQVDISCKVKNIYSVIHRPREAK